MAMAPRKGDGSGPRVQKKSGDRVEQIVHLVEDAFNRHEDWKIEEAVGDHFLDHSTSWGGVSFRERARIVRTMLEDPKLEIHELMVWGNLVASKWSLTGRHTGKLLGFEPTGRELTITGIAVDRLKDGRSVEHWELPDLDKLTEELAEYQKAG
jgi:predicted ester cyclase